MSSATTVYCSGLRSDARPSAGPGIARSLREGFADLEIVGVDDAPGSSGLHDDVFDEIWIRRPAAGSAGEVLERLDGGAWWIPGSELDARRLAREAGAHERLLSPSPEALAAFDVPLDELARRLGLDCPPAISTREDDWRLGAFGREHGWRLWLLGPGYAPAQIDGWRTLESRRAHLGAAWSAPGLRLQAHVEGVAEAVAFAAHRGRALGMLHLHGAIRKPEPWGGEVTDLAVALPRLAPALASALSDARWTGGGEIEIVRSVDDELWLIAWLPRFASWIHGATLTGANLPAALAGAALGRDPAPALRRASQFVRVVVELPARAGCDLPEPVSGADGSVRAGGYLNRMPDPGRAGAHAREAAVEPAEDLKAIVRDVRTAAATPFAHAVDPAPRWRTLAARVRAPQLSCRVEIAYSIKTDPDASLLRAARAHGFLAEAITAAELRAAQAAGFQGDEVILNGPAKSWPPWTSPLRAYGAFADSLDELASLARLARSGALSARYLGPRLRPPSVASRFGIPLGDFATFSGLVSLLRDLPGAQPLGLHFHWASSEAGHAMWFDTVEATLEWGRRLQDATGRAIRCVDLGGGWQPDDFDAVLLPRLADLLARCRDELDELEVVVIEPGRALVQPLCVVESSVLELRGGTGAREVVVDASLAEVPRAPVYPHRVLSRSGGDWRLWGRGPDRVVGRLCMEDDVLRTGVAVPDDVRAGSRILFADAGAYDRSMAYSFGRG